MSHDHAHHHHIEKNTKGTNLLISIGLNIIITVSQIIGGLLSGSLALLSDALHNFSDVLSLIVINFYKSTVTIKDLVKVHPYL